MKDWSDFLCSVTFRSPEHRIFSVGCRTCSPSVARHLVVPFLVRDRRAFVEGRRTPEPAIHEHSCLAAAGHVSSAVHLLACQLDPCEKCTEKFLERNQD